MKVLIMNPILYTSETDCIPKVKSIKDTMIYALCMGFVQNGDEPVLIAADRYKPIEEEEYPFEIKWFSCRLPQICKPRCLPWLKGLGKFLRQHKGEYDYIISSEVFSLSTLYGSIYAKKKMIIWHELGAHNHFLKKIPSQIWYHIIAPIFFHNIPIIPRSGKAAEFISKFCHYVLPLQIDHGVDLDKIGYSLIKDNYFVVVSQLIERKHVDEIIQRFAEFRQGKYSEYELKIIGSGVLEDALKEQVKRLKEEESICFLGKLDHGQLMPILAKAKGLLINTSKDNSMVSIAEGIAAGTPVLTTPIPFNAEYIQKEKLGIVKEKWGKNELMELCENNEFYVKQCLNYREKLSNQYFAKEFNRIGGLL